MNAWRFSHVPHVHAIAGSQQMSHGLRGRQSERLSFSGVESEKRSAIRCTDRQGTSRKINSCLDLALMLSFLACCYALAFAQEPSQPSPILEPNKPEEHAWGGRESNGYAIRVTAGEYFRISVLQRGGTLTLLLLAPDLQPIVKTDNSKGNLERLIVSAVADKSGNYLLILTAGDDDKDKSYRVSIEEQRTATPDDKQRVRAERAQMEAEQLRVQGSHDSLLKAINTYEVTLSFWQGVGAHKEEAHNLTILGELNASINDKQKALFYYTKALQRWRTTKESEPIARTLNETGLIHSRLNQGLKALDDFQESLSIWRSLGDQSGQAYTLELLGKTYTAFGDYRKSLDQYNQALNIWRQTNNREGTAFTLAAIGQVYDSSLDFQKASNYYGEALNLWATEGNEFGEDYMLRKLYFTSGMSHEAAASANLSEPSAIAGPRNPTAFDKAQERTLWRQLDSLNDPMGFDVYLRHFPTGAFAEPARDRLKESDQRDWFELTQDSYRHSSSRKARPRNPRTDRNATVDRYPAIECPDPMVVDQEFEVLISLSTSIITPEVKVSSSAGAATSSIPLDLPNKDGWNIEVVLMAPDFVLPSGNRATLFLPKSGDSTPTRFMLRPKAIPGSQQTSKLSATLWYENGYLGKIERNVTIVRVPAAPLRKENALSTPSPAKPPELQKPIQLNFAQKSADLTIWIFKSANSDKLEIQILSNYLEKTNPDAYSHDGLSDWLDVQYRELSRRSAQLAEFDSAEDADAQKKLSESTKDRMRGVSLELYRKFCPESVKRAFWELSGRLGSSFKTIQIYSDDFEMPWELMRPVSSEGKERGMLGMEFAVGRWPVSPTASGLKVPPQSLPLNKLVVIAPEYKDNRPLPNQQSEINTLQSMIGYQRWPGTLVDMKNLFQDFPVGVIYFAGHGAVLPTERNLFEYSIQLEDGSLSLMTWRGMINPLSKNHPFFFFNACSIGQTQRVANFVDGWAPAVLEAGASGYVGALWSVSDRGAANFGTSFYREFDERLKRGPVSISETLMETRRKFMQNGDPTFLAYIYYGDAELSLVREPK
jgi:tetratricopeptide (TPR) repeat protein